ncbi:ion channel [Flavobacterium silvaticum]|uniref:Inward rectifier potassium channel Irk n=1 Tax=Flavobacterium silvaticum TaxID=1852020 RepID=A0A972JIE0_9FLAO|nr:ion channel [Flavobacterium silvaticum]NMH28123.1 Inward rectifier potassium channel Irk [Flavobacterium silvaticum]
MALFNKVNTRAQATDSSGFGTNPGSYGGRFINKDGSANIRKRGMSRLSRISWYHTMLEMPRWKFLLILVAFYTGVNFIFALVYYGIGIQYLDGIDATGPEWIKFGKAYFFSAQTFTTVGYGHISPNGFFTSAVAATEALTGLLSFAIATGLFYGRFSRPKAYLKFSDKALIAPYKGITGLMLRVVPFKNADLLDAEVKVTLAMSVSDGEKAVNKFYVLELEMTKITSLSLSWTLVHPITESSPLYGMTETDFQKADGEVIVYMRAFDDMYSATVAARTSYTFDEIEYGARFNMMYFENEDNTITELHLDKLNSTTKVQLP